jgi:4-diphosphocytidyl-2C-methyl-D-erythritol kinase
MSGSGSACFAPLGEGTDAVPILAAIREAWGPSAFAIEARLA